jgi:hypothetical protein
LLRAGFALAVFSLACQPVAFPRSGEIVPRGQVAAEVHLPIVQWEPQRVTVPQTNGRQLVSYISWSPVISGAVRGSLGGCEIGGLYQWTRVGAEVRCGLLQERWGQPLSIALSGMLAFDFGVYAAPFGRIGLDASRRFGPLKLLANAYLSAGDAYRFIEDPDVIPIEGPFIGAQVVTRREVRLTVPLGIAIRAGHIRESESWVWLVLGATPWWVLNKQPSTWDAGVGMIFSVGFEVR